MSAAQPTPKSLPSPARHSLREAPGSTSVTFELEGQHTQDPRRWSCIGSHKSKDTARKDESEYRDWNANRTPKGWLDFRIVRVTVIREIMSNH